MSETPYWLLIGMAAFVAALVRSLISLVPLAVGKWKDSKLKRFLLRRI